MVDDDDEVDLLTRSVLIEISNRLAPPLVQDLWRFRKGPSSGRLGRGTAEISFPYELCISG